MNKLEITDTAKFEEKINNIEAALPTIQNAFASQRRNSEGIKGTDTWQGLSQEALYEKYKILEQNFSPIEESIMVYIRFLRKTLEDYKALEASFDAKAEESSNQLDVNS